MWRRIADFASNNPVLVKGFFLMVVVTAVNLGLLSKEWKDVFATGLVDVLIGASTWITRKQVSKHWDGGGELRLA